MIINLLPMLTANLVLVLILVFLIIYLVSTVLIRLLNKNKSSDSPDWVSKEAYEIMQNATQKAEEIISGAEKDSLKIASSAELGTELFKGEYAQRLDESLAAATEQFKQRLDEASKQYQELIGSLQKNSQDVQSEVEKTIQTRINEALLNFEQNLSNYLTQAEQKSFESINLELKSARNLIDTYKQQQLQLIDENIVAVLERTMALVLRNKLSLKDQMDLVFEALEKAKMEKFFA